ncbi:MAG TPA: BLUF domain-containing protein [Friedmanniella sp.]
MVFQLVYSSTAVQPVGPEVLVGLLTQSRASNARCDVTGMLLYRDGRFLQLLEGRESVVRRLFATITADERHRGVVTLSEGRRLLRQFPGWTMSFRDLAEEPITQPGYTALFQEAVENVTWAVDELLPRMRPARSTGRPVVHLGGVGGASVG